MRLDSRVLGFALLVCLLTPLLFGLAPALYGSKLDLNETLKEGRRGSRAVGIASAARVSGRSSEVGLAVALLGLGGLFIRLMMLFMSAIKARIRYQKSVDDARSRYPSPPIPMTLTLRRFIGGF